MSKKERLKHTDCELSWSPESSLQMRQQARGPPAPLSVGKASSDLDAAPRGPEMPATQPSSSQPPCTVFLSSSTPTAARAQAQRAHLWHISRQFFYAVWALACPRADGRPAAASDAHTDGLPLRAPSPSTAISVIRAPLTGQVCQPWRLSESQQREPRHPWRQETGVFKALVS